MFDVAKSLAAGLRAAAAGLSGAANATASAQLRRDSSRSAGAMARAADRAIFEEALLDAVHARLEEIKGVTK